MVKTCTKCKKEKKFSEFNKNKNRKDGLQTFCRFCSKISNASHYKNNEKYRARIRKRNKELKIRNRITVFNYLKSHPCIDCGESDPIVLEFDHRNDSSKKIEVSKAVSWFETKKLLEEINKCDIRCANCHRRKTAKDFEWYKGIIDQ